MKSWHASQKPRIYFLSTCQCPSYIIGFPFSFLAVKWCFCDRSCQASADDSTLTHAMAIGVDMPFTVQKNKQAQASQHNCILDTVGVDPMLN